MGQNAVFLTLWIAAFLGTAASGKADPLICEDLYAAACLSPDGKNKKLEEIKKAIDHSKETIRVARQITAAGMGFVNIDSLLKARLLSAGLKINEPLDENIWKELKEKSLFEAFAKDYETSKVFTVAGQCSKDASEIESSVDISIPFLGDSKKKQQSRYDDFWSKYKDELLTLHSNNLQDFISMSIAPKCSILQKEPEIFKAQFNSEISKICENFNGLKSEAVRIYRLEKTPEYAQESKKFVSKYLIPELIFPLRTSEMFSVSSGKSPTAQELAETKLKLFKFGGARIFCKSLTSALDKTANKVYEELLIELNVSKPTIEHLIHTFYNDENKKVALTQFDLAKSEAQNTVKSFVTNPLKIRAITENFKSLGLQWLQMPSADSFVRNSKGILELDLSQVPRIGFASDKKEVFSIFTDPSLSHFTSTNATYTPQLSVGQQVANQRVAIEPTLLLSMKDKTFNSVFVMGHEIAHSLDPRNSKISGFDLNSEYAELLKCYRSPKSINLRFIQDDEAIADYLSSEFLARQIARLPQEERKRAILEMTETMCLIDGQNAIEHYFNCKGNHPEMSLRIGGIVGANPNLRRMAGCKEDSSKFQSCGINALKLPEDLPPPRTPNPGAPATQKRVQ